MHTFTDTQGRIWTIHITVDTIRRVRALTGRGERLILSRQGDRAHDNAVQTSPPSQVR